MSEQKWCLTINVEEEGHAVTIASTVRVKAVETCDLTRKFSYDLPFLVGRGHDDIVDLNGHSGWR